MSVKMPLYHCFRCGSSGRVRGSDADEAWLAEPVARPAVEDTEAGMPPEGYTPLLEAASPLFDAAKEYLHGRGLHEDVWQLAKIGACVYGRYAGRIIVPIFSTSGEWLGFSGRAWVKKAEVPYIYPNGMRRGEILYNHQALLDRWSSPIVVVEGVFDALALWPQAVAVLGKASQEQIEALAACDRPIAVCLDPDALREARAMVYQLRAAGKDAGFIELPPGLDPDEVDRDWLLAEATACLKPGRPQP
jgi:hypothetical protein